MKFKLAKIETLVLIALSLLVSVELCPPVTGLSPVLQTAVVTDLQFYAQGELVNIMGNVSDRTGVPVSGSTVALEVHDSSSNIIFLDTTTTNMNGSFADSFRLAIVAPSGNYTVYVVATKAGYTSAQNQTTFSVGSSTGVAFAVWTQKNQYIRFENAFVYGRVLYNRTTLQDALLTFNIIFPNGTTWMTITNMTDTTGTATQSFNLPPTIPAGQYQINASSYDDGYPNATATDTFTIQNVEPVIYQVSVNPHVVEAPGNLAIQANASDYEDYLDLTVLCIVTFPNQTVQILNMTLSDSLFNLQYPVLSMYPSGTYSLTVRAIDQDAGSCDYQTTFEVTSPPQTGSVSGTILNSAGNGIANSSVTLSMITAYNNYETTTNALGQYNFINVVSGEYSLSASAASYNSQSQDIQVTNSTLIWNLTLSHLPIITGFVTTQNGSPIFNATITVTASSGSTSRNYTDATGSYKIVAPSFGFLTVTAQAAQFVPNSTILMCSLEQTAQASFSLTQDGALDAQVTDAYSRTVITNATAILLFAQFTATNSTDTNGNVKFGSVPPGIYQLVVEADNYISNSTYISIYSNQISTIQLALSPAGNITGTVTDAISHQPINNAQVLLSTQNDITLDAASTDSNGNYLFNLVPPGTYTVAVYAEGYNSTLFAIVFPPFGNITENFGLNPSVITLDVESSASQFSRGETASFTVTPENSLGQAISNVAAVSITLRGPANETRNLAVNPEGNSFVADYTFLNNETMGLWTATFFVRDTLGNTAQVILPIEVEDAFFVAFQTNQLTYVSTDTVNFTAYIARYSNTTLLLNASQVNAKVEIYNSQNVSINSFSLIRTASCFTSLFPLTNIPLETYTAYLNVSDSNGDSTTATLSFTMVQDIQINVQTDKLLYNLTDTAKITGNLTFTNGTSIPDTNVQLLFNLNGLSETYTVTADNSGNFDFQFNLPLAGNYTLTCSTTEQGITRSTRTYFSVLGLTINPTYPVVNMPAGSIYDLTLNLANNGQTTLTGITLNVSLESGNGVTVNIIKSPISILSPGSSTSVTLQITVSPSATSETNFILTATSNEGCVTNGSLNINAFPATPVMNWSPQIIDESLSPGTYVTETVTVQNIGYATLNNVSLTLPSTPWITPLTISLGDIAPQDSTTFDLLIAPPNGTSIGLYQDQLNITSSNYPTMPLYIDVKVTSDQSGSLAFQITDDAGQKVQGATVTIQYQEYYTQTQTATTDPTGYSLFPSLPSGLYSYIITANGHQTVSGTATVQPDSTLDVQEIMPVQIMDVSFNVLPITINDNYYITLNMTFKANVPVPLLIPTPPVLQFETDRATVIQQGFVQTVTLDLNNFGSIPVSDVSLNVEDGVPANYNIGLGTTYEPIIPAGADLQVPCTLTVEPNTNIDLLNNGAVGKISITGTFVYVDGNGNSVAAKVNAEVLVLILDVGNRVPEVNPPDIYYSGTDTSLFAYPPSWTFLNQPVTITNPNDAEQLYIFSQAAGLGGYFSVDIFGPGEGVILLRGSYARASSIGTSTAPESANQIALSVFRAGASVYNMVLGPQESVTLLSSFEGLSLPLSPPEGLGDLLTSIIGTLVNLPGISVGAGVLYFDYRWYYDSTDSVQAIPVFITQVSTSGISIPVLAGVGGGNTGSGWWQNGPSNPNGAITVAAPSVTVPSMPTVQSPITPAPVSDVNEVVQLSISQQATLERDAFQANLNMANSLSSSNIENVNAKLRISYLNGTDASQDFYSSVTNVEGISDVNGNGIITPGATASACWVIIPNPGAGGTNDAGVYYTIQAQILYSVNNVQFTLFTSNATICVQPQPYLDIDYYLPQNVTGNVPFELGVKVTNVGYGTAHSFSIGSAQPTITSDLSGLPIIFELIGSYVEGSEVTNSLLLNFGDIAPGQTVLGYWEMVCTFNGNFTSFDATYTHSSDLGGAETSLIGVTTHILMRDIMTSETNFAFLIGTNSTTPDQIINPSTGDATPVVPVNYNIINQGSGSLTIQTGKSTGNWIWIPVDDPFNNQKSVLEIQRSDGKIINRQNYWMANGQIYILDDLGENYTIFYSLPADLAVNNMTLFKTIVGRGYTMNVTATVENQGFSAESFNLTVYANSTAINTQQVILTNGSSTTLIYTWNTTGFSYGSFTLGAYAWPVPGETNIANNNFTGGVLIVTIPGDINGDFKVSLQDLVFLANAYGTTPASGGTPGVAHAWNSNADIDNNGVVGLTDLVILALHYGQHYP